MRRQMQANGATSRRTRNRRWAPRGDRGWRSSSSYAAALKRPGLRSAPTPSRTAFMQWRSGEHRAAAESGRRAPRFGAMRSRTAAWGSQSPRRPRARSGPLSRRLRGRQQPQGRLSGLVNVAAGALSSRQQRRRSKKGPAALALVAGAAGVAVVKRRRSAAANEPTGEGFAGAEHKTGAQTARADRPAQEPPTAPEPDAEREPGASGRGSSKSEGGLA
jgi:hypothetical protein